MTKNKSLLAATLCFCSIGIISCDGENRLTSLWGAPSCDSERQVGDWTVAAGLGKSDVDGIFFNKWEARKEFASDFELRLTYDTSQRPTPYLRIWHYYKSGQFKMVLPENGLIITTLSTSFAVTDVALRPVDVDYMRRAPVSFEYIENQRYQKYGTDGLPEAIIAAEEDLAAAKQKLNDNACAPSRA